MSLYVPITGPDAGRLVRREPAPSSSAAAPPDEAALDACVPGRAALRELWAPSGDPDRGRRGAAGAAAELVKRGVDPTTARERVNQARQRAHRST